jgi:uncharacterized membrane protein YgaE (UPF0421/DUF939 family)
MTRPFHSPLQFSQDVDASAILGPKNSDKVRKSNQKKIPCKSSGIQYVQEYISSLETNQDMLLKEVETLERTILKLELGICSRDEEIKKLIAKESEAVKTQRKTKAEQSKYERNMNEVIASYKLLKSQAVAIKDNTSAALEAEKRSAEMVEEVKKSIEAVKNVETKTGNLLKDGKYRVSFKTIFLLNQS